MDTPAEDGSSGKDTSIRDRPGVNPVDGSVEGLGLGWFTRPLWSSTFVKKFILFFEICSEDYPTPLVTQSLYYVQLYKIIGIIQ